MSLSEVCTNITPTRTIYTLPGHNLQHLPRALGGCIVTGIFYLTLWTKLNKMAILNYLSYAFGGGGMKVEISCPPITFNSLKGAKTFNFQKDEPSLTFIRASPSISTIYAQGHNLQRLSPVSKFLSIVFEKKGMKGRLVTLWSLLTLKSELELLISNQMSPFWSLYDHFFHRNHICPKGITYKAYPPDPEDLFKHRSFFYMIFKLFLTEWNLKFLSDVFGGKGRRRGGG